MYIDLITENAQTNKMLDIYEKTIKEFSQKIKRGKRDESKKTLFKSRRKIIRQSKIGNRFRFCILGEGNHSLSEELKYLDATALAGLVRKKEIKTD